MSAEARTLEKDELMNFDEFRFETFTSHCHALGYKNQMSASNYFGTTIFKTWFKFWSKRKSIDNSVVAYAVQYKIT